TTHSRFLPTCGDAPKMPTNGGLFQCVLRVSRSPEGVDGRFRTSVSAAKNPVPGARKGVGPRVSPRSCRCWKRAASEICKCEEVESGLGQTKPLKLQRPFGRRITQGGDADAARKPPFDGGLDQSWRDEGHRYRHVDLANAALLARGNGFDAGSATDDLVEPGTSARDGFDQCRTSPRLHWSRARSCGRGWKQDLLEPLGRRLRPRDQQRGVFFDRGRWNR